jgi:hypothetical protein
MGVPARRRGGRSRAPTAALLGGLVVLGETVATTRQMTRVGRIVHPPMRGDLVVASRQSDEDVTLCAGPFNSSISVPEAAARAGVNPAASIHWFRHAYAYRAIDTYHAHLDHLGPRRPEDHHVNPTWPSCSRDLRSIWWATCNARQDGRRMRTGDVYYRQTEFDELAFIAQVWLSCRTPS